MNIRNYYSTIYIEAGVYLYRRSNSPEVRETMEFSLTYDSILPAAKNAQLIQLWRTIQPLCLLHPFNEQTGTYDHQKIAQQMHLELRNKPRTARNQKRVSDMVLLSYGLHRKGFDGYTGYSNKTRKEFIVLHDPISECMNLIEFISNLPANMTEHHEHFSGAKIIRLTPEERIYGCRAERDNTDRAGFLAEVAQEDATPF
ncbi:MAG: hypothetical protein Fur0041_09830 [Bacteroidia bacterium]